MRLGFLSLLCFCIQFAKITQILATVGERSREAYRAYLFNSDPSVPIHLGASFWARFSIVVGRRSSEIIIFAAHCFVGLHNDCDNRAYCHLWLHLERESKNGSVVFLDLFDTN